MELERGGEGLVAVCGGLDWMSFDAASYASTPTRSVMLVKQVMELYSYGALCVVAAERKIINHWAKGLWTGCAVLLAFTVALMGNVVSAGCCQD